MRLEINTNASERYLLCTFNIPDKILETLKLEIISFMANREKDEYYFRFIDWHKKKNEIMVLTMYAYADIILPKQFDIIFEIDNPNNFVHTDFSITQVVLNSWVAINEISHGHKHFVVLNFKDSIPKIIKKLPIFKSKWPLKKQTQLGFCNKTDFEAIRNKSINHSTT